MAPLWLTHLSEVCVAVFSGESVLAREVMALVPLPLLRLDGLFFKKSGAVVARFSGKKHKSPDHTCREDAADEFGFLCLGGGGEGNVRVEMTASLVARGGKKKKVQWYSAWRRRAEVRRKNVQCERTSAPA